MQGTGQTISAQLLSEIKVPSRLNKHKKVWQKKVGVRNEALDCEVYALYAARSLGTHSMSANKWALYEQALLQAELFTPLPNLKSSLKIQ